MEQVCSGICKIVQLSTNTGPDATVQVEQQLKYRYQHYTVVVHIHTHKIRNSREYVYGIWQYKVLNIKLFEMKWLTKLGNCKKKKVPNTCFLLLFFYEQIVNTKASDFDI